MVLEWKKTCVKRCRLCEKVVAHLPGCGKCDECCQRTCEEQWPAKRQEASEAVLEIAIEDAFAHGVSVETVEVLVRQAWRRHQQQNSEQEKPEHVNTIDALFPISRR